MRFSIVIPVYNVEKYLRKCLESVVNQTYKDFELIIVNDSSTDKSQEIIDEYVKKYDFIKAYTKEYGGVSDARNFGIAKASGDYLVFIDSDDYIDKEHLARLSNVIDLNNDVDVIGFNAKKVDEHGELLEDMILPHFENLSGEDAIVELVNAKIMFDPVWTFAYSRKYWREHGFQYAKGLLHEDFGLTPIVILKAKKVTCVDLAGYYYVKRSGSIMTSRSFEMEQKRNNDLIAEFDILKNEIESKDFENKYAEKLLKAYIANAMILRAEGVEKRFVKDYKSKIKSRRIFDWVIDDTFKRKIRRLIMKIKFSLL